MRKATTKEAIRIEARKTRDEVRFWAGVCLVLLFYIAYYVRRDVIMAIAGFVWTVLFVFRAIDYYREKAKNNEC